jgi:hypothetical protein
MGKRIISGLVFATIASLITYLFSGVFYNYAYAPEYLVALFLFMFIIWFIFYPFLLGKVKKKDKKL